MGTMMSDTWSKAKKEFTAITGEKKPKPKGFVFSALNHTGLTDCLKKCDKSILAISVETKDMAKKRKLISQGQKVGAELDKAAKSYMKVLETTAKNEEADKNQKTKYYKGLKFLKSSLDAVDKSYAQQIDGFLVAIDQQTSTLQKSAKMVNKSLASACAIASAALKKIKSDPTLDRFNEFFGATVSDTVARRVQVQMVAAAIAQNKGDLPADISGLDARDIANQLTQWQVGGKNKCVSIPNWGKSEVMARVEEFKKVLKLAARFSVELANQT